MTFSFYCLIVVYYSFNYSLKICKKLNWAGEVIECSKVYAKFFQGSYLAF